MVASRANPTVVYIGGGRQPGDGDPGASFPNSLLLTPVAPSVPVEIQSLDVR
jgi:hypothetical protein